MAGVDPQRRELLRAALAGSVIGGLGLQAGVGQAQFPPAATGGGLLFADGFELRSSGPGPDIAPLRITSAVAGLLPWTVGHVFRKGDVPLGTIVGGSGVALQVEMRNTWPDGSLRFAVISGLTPASTITLRRGGVLAAGVHVAEPAIAAVVTLSNVRDHTGAVLHAALSASLANARAAGASAWNRATPRRVRQSLGPLMSEFHYYSPTADAHLAVWWHVRAYSDGRVEVTTLVENGWLQVSAPGERVYNVEVSIGGSSRYSASGISHRHHTRWSRVDWIGGDPAVTPIHDTRYLQRTRMVPGMGIRSVAPSVYDPYAATREQAERGTLFDLANVNPGLGGGGHSDSYGIVPGWEQAHLISGEPRMYWAAMRNARYAAGRFHVHYRDEATGAPARGSTHFNLRLNNSNSGIHDNSGGTPATPLPAGALNSPSWFFSHGPALGYGAYLLSGRYEFAESVAFFSTVADLWQNDLNQYEGYRIAWWGMQLRQRAHIFRLRAQHALIAPRTFGGSAVAGEDAAQVAEAEGRLNAEINYYRQIYVAGGNNTVARLVAHRDNALGVWAAGDADGVTDGRYTVPGLQQALNILPTLWAYDAESSVNPNFQLLIEFTARWPLGLFGTLPNGENWDWRLMSCYTCNMGIDAANAVVTIDPSWNALWTRLTTTYSWQVMGGGTPTTNPASIPPDKRLRSFQTRDGSSVAWIEPIPQLGNFADNFTATLHTAAAVGILHQIADSGRLPALSGACLTAAGRLYESDTFRDSMVAGSFLRTNILYSQWGLKSSAFRNEDYAAATLNALAAARALVAPTEWTWVQVSNNTFQSALPPVGLRDDFSGGEGIEQIITAWGGWVWNPDRLSFEYNGTGHSAAGCTEWFSWSAVTREHSLAYYGSEQIAVNGGPYHRSPDFNSTPPSAHPYDNQCYGKMRRRVYQAYAGTFNSGNRGRMWNPAQSGAQSLGSDGLPGPNATSIFEIDMSQAGTGKVLGATGSNPARGANAGTVLTGANAAAARDWIGLGAQPFFLGVNPAIGVEGSIAYSNEVPAKDSFYWTAGNKWLVRTTINSDNPAQDTHQLVARESLAYGQARGSVQISLDPIRRVVVVITNDIDANPGCVAFADLKRAFGGGESWRSATLTGPDIAEFLALNRLDMGIQYDPVSGKHLAYNGLGRQVWGITPPAASAGVTPDTGWLLEKLPMNAVQPGPPPTADPQNTVGQVPGAEQIIGVNGKWKHADELRAHAFIEGQLAGRVWMLLGPQWTDPRSD
jgi:hypothetical protein